MDDVETTLESGPSLSTQNIVWIVRIALPILVFFFYWLQQKGPSQKNVYSRDVVLMARKDAETDEAPVSLRTLRLVDETVAQQLLGYDKAPRQGGAGARQRQNSGRAARSMSGDKLGGGKGADNTAIRKTSSARDFEADTGTPSAPPREPKKLLSDEERTHLASLLNYAAFLHKDRPSRIFLCDTGRPPPPPPIPRVKSILGPVLLEADSPEAVKANKEAQMVLKGLVNPKFGLKGENIPKSLHHSLTEHQTRTPVRTSEATYSLMVEACVNARDLKGASDFLMKMESAGHCADSDLLDKVMDLYQENTVAKSGAEPESVRRDSEESNDVAPARSWNSPIASAGTGLGARARPGGGFSGGGIAGNRDKDWSGQRSTAPLSSGGMRPPMAAWSDEDDD